MTNAIRVIPRIIKKDGTAILFLPDLPANPGRVMSYLHVGQHGEAALDFYHRDTRPAFPHDQAAVSELLEEYSSMPPASTLQVLRKMPARPVTYNWRPM